jgi:hypothetical protein
MPVDIEESHRNNNEYQAKDARFEMVHIKVSQGKSPDDSGIE